MKYTVIIIGIIIVLSSVWGGTYMLHIFPPGNWQNFPIFVTSFFVFIGGGFVVGHGMFGYEPPKD